MNKKQLQDIWLKTNGHCHFCGDPIELEKHGWKTGSAVGTWEVDHVIQKHKGGVDASTNYLPACTACNRLRWHRSGDAVRELLLLGVIARDQIKKNTAVGKELVSLKEKRLRGNLKRRKRLA